MHQKTTLPVWAAAFIVALAVTLGSAAPASAQQSYYLFESGQVRPMAMSPNGNRLFVVNTPDNRLEVLSITPGGLVHQGSVEVGMEPVAVAARTNGEVWVVNHCRTASAWSTSRRPRPAWCAPSRSGTSPATSCSPGRPTSAPS
jgi:hypothetical protein